MHSLFIKTALGILKGRFGYNVPLKVEHIVTYRCNLKCVYCGLWKQRCKELNTGDIMDLMDKFNRLGTVSWNFTGGEPLVRNDIGELVNYAHKLGFYITFNSNAVLIKEFKDWFSHIDLFGVSLDGTKTFYESTRGKYFDNVMNAINILKSNGINVYICSVINKGMVVNDYKGLNELLDLVKSLDVPMAPLPIFEDRLNIKTVDSLIPSRERLIYALKRLKKFKKENPRLLMMSDSSFRYFEEGMLPINCYGGKYFVTLYPNGKIGQCLFRGEYDFNELKSIKPVGLVNCNKDRFRCQLCYLEYNHLFSLKPSFIREFLFKYLK